MKSLAFSAFIAAAFLAAGPAQAASPIGFWVSEDGRARVEIAPCGAALCGTPDGGKSPVVFNLMSVGPNVWSGPAFRPADGETHAVSMTLAGDARLILKSCLAVLCLEQVWVRAN